MKYIFSLVFCLSVFADCKITQEFESKLSSAGTYSNFRNKEGSIRFETARILNKAETLVSSPMIYSAKPNKFLTNYSDQKNCLALQQSTTSNPIKYPGIKFNTYEEFSELISDVSQGRGDYGKDLYKKCPGSCSPQYNAVIRTGASKTADLIIVCGEARDKDDNQYLVSVGSNPSCN